MAKFSIRFTPETLRSLAFGSIGAGYAAIGTAIENPIRIFYLQNWTDANLMFSFDGVNDHMPLSVGGFVVIDITANKPAMSSGFYLAKGDLVYVKRIGAPTTGSVYLSVFHGNEA